MKRPDDLDINNFSEWCGLESHKPSMPHSRHRKAVYTKGGIIIECPLNGLSHDCRDIIITSQMAVRKK